MNFKEFLMTEEQEITNFLQYLTEGTGKSLEDLLTKIPSERNRYFLKERQEKGKSGSVLKFVIWNEKEDYIRLVYHTVPTYDKQVKIISSTKTGKF